MNAQELFTAGGQSAGVWYCEKCKSMRTRKKFAESCCTPKVCECGEPVAGNRTNECNRCHQYKNDLIWRERLDRATLVDHDGWVWSRDVDGIRDGYFQSVDELIEYTFDNESDVPEYAFACNAKILQVDICDILERLDDNGWEEMTEHASGVQELSDSIDKFNELNRETFMVYEADYSRKVAVKSATPNPQIALNVVVRDVSKRQKVIGFACRAFCRVSRQLSGRSERVN